MIKNSSCFGKKSKNGSTSTKSSMNPNYSTNLFPSNVVSNYPSNNLTQKYLPKKFEDETIKNIMFIQNDKKEMGNNEISKFHENYAPNMIVKQNTENIEKLNIQEEMPNNQSSTFFMKNQNYSQGQIKNIINYMNKMLQEQLSRNQIQMNKMLQEQNMNHQIQMNKMLQEQNMSHQNQMNKILQQQNMINQIQMNKQIQYIKEDFQNKINLVNNELSTNKNDLTSTKSELSTTINKLKEVYNKIEKMNNSYEQSIKEVKNNINDLKLYFELNASTEDKYISLINKIIEIINTMTEEVWKNKVYLNNQIKTQNYETKSLKDEILFLKKKINDLQGIIIGLKLIKILLKKIIDSCFERIFLSSDFKIRFAFVKAEKYINMVHVANRMIEILIKTNHIVHINGEMHPLFDLVSSNTTYGDILNILKQSFVKQNDIFLIKELLEEKGLYEQNCLEDIIGKDVELKELINEFQNYNYL